MVRPVHALASVAHAVMIHRIAGLVVMADSRAPAVPVILEKAAVFCSHVVSPIHTGLQCHGELACFFRTDKQ